MIDRIRVLVVDDHPFLLSGICAEIESEEDMTVVATARDGQEGLRQYEKHRPDVALVDIRMPKMTGIELISALRTRDSDARIIVLTTTTADAQIEAAFRQGARAYLLKHMLRDDLISTIRAVYVGQLIVPKEVARLLSAFDADQRLTPREVQILSKVAKGFSNKDIADDLRISEHTVKSYLKVILQKLNANDRTHAVTIAVQRGFLDLQPI
jgi:DNA-binding NarL/FixJ family response regulator